MIRIFAVLLIATFAHAAPVPKQPPPPAFTADRLVGRWHCAWGGARNGAYTFAADGTFTGKTDLASETVYAGRWAFDGTVLTLHERGTSARTGNTWGPITYRIDFGTTRPPDLVGKLDGGPMTVAFSNPQR